MLGPPAEALSGSIKEEMSMTNNRFDGLSEQDDLWVKEVSLLQCRLSGKLKAIGFYRSGQNDGISHHLAEVSFACSMIAERHVPTFLQAEGLELSNVSVDLVEDIREMKEAIEAMEIDLIKLMNFLNP
jgi:hypothetical protein